MKFDTKVLKSLSLISQVGILMFVPIFGCVLIGNYLDKLFNTNILFLLIFIILGVGAAFRNLYILAMKVTKKDKKK